MIVWINGPFGVGKTAVGKRLVEVVPDAVHFDPELVGRMIRRTLPATEGVDYQTLPLWRESVVDFARRLERRSAGPVVIPMTLWSDRIHDEIIGGLLGGGTDVVHFTLLASSQTILGRIASSDDRDAAAWRTEHLHDCLDVLLRERYSTHVDTEGQTVDSIAALITEHLLQL